MADTRTVQVQAETRGAVPEGAASFAVYRVSSLMRMAPEPVLSARVKLTTAADPAVERPAIAQVNIDLNGRLIRAQAAGETMRAAADHAYDRLRVRIGRAARNWAAIRDGQPVAGPGDGGTKASRRRGCPTTRGHTKSAPSCGTSPTRWHTRPRMRRSPTPGCWVTTSTCS
jgi:ribosome-associated translation inhibitor RaiA